jgi:hypothetical protein
MAIGAKMNFRTSEAFCALQQVLRKGSISMDGPAKDRSPAKAEKRPAVEPVDDSEPSQRGSTDRAAPDQSAKTHRRPSWSDTLRQRP